MATPAPLQTSNNAAARYERDEADGRDAGPASSEGGASASGTAGVGAGTSTAGAALGNIDISSPHELTDWVDRVLEQLETRFDGMNEQFVKRMKEMSERIDALETSIEDLIVGATAPVAAEK